MKVTNANVKIKETINMQPSVIAINNTKTIGANLLSDLSVSILNHKISLITANTSSHVINSWISKIIYLNSPIVPVMSVDFFFTSADLVDNKLTKFHGFNGTVDVSVFDDLNKEVEVYVDVSDPNRVTIDLGRLIVQNNWQIKIER